MTDTPDVMNLAGAASVVAARPAAEAMPAAVRGKLECDEAEFAVCCLALCDWHAYDITGGRINIRAEA